MAENCIIMAGVPATNNTLYHRFRLTLGDPVVYLHWSDDSGKLVSTVIVRDIEMPHARRLKHIDHVHCPADFPPPGGLDGDRETATAESAAQLLRQNGITTVTTDRTLPYIFADHLQQVGIEINYDAELGVLDRRVKTEQEIGYLRTAQHLTEQAMTMACQTIARAEAAADGTLMHEGQPLTSERIRNMIAVYCMERDCSAFMDSIVATTPHTAECHHFGAGPLRTGDPVIVDIFPRHNASRYCGDCTRTVVHGQPTDELLAMHAAVVDAKSQAIAALKPGTTGDTVHRVTVSVIQKHGYTWGPTPTGPGASVATMSHGTGHGIGLDIHEPILLADNGGAILAGEVFTVEPGLYSAKFGGVRVEDMVVVTEKGPMNLNTLGEGLDWR